MKRSMRDTARAAKLDPGGVTAIRKRFARELVDHGEAFQALAVRAGVEQEVVDPRGSPPRPAADEAASSPRAVAVVAGAATTLTHR